MTEETNPIPVLFVNGMVIAPAQIRTKEGVFNGSAMAFELVSGEVLEVVCAASLKEIADLIRLAKEKGECKRIDFLAPEGKK